MIDTHAVHVCVIGYGRYRCLWQSAVLRSFDVASMYLGIFKILNICALLQQQHDLCARVYTICSPMRDRMRACGVLMHFDTTGTMLVAT